MDKIDGLNYDFEYDISKYGNKNAWIDVYADRDDSFYYQCPNCHHIEDNPNPPSICPSCGQLLTE